MISKQIILISAQICVRLWIQDGAELFQRTRERQRQRWGKMTQHNLSCLLAQCKSKSNLPWQVQLSWQHPSGISNTLTIQIKPICLEKVSTTELRRRIVIITVNTDGLTACHQTDSDYILMTQHFGEMWFLSPPRAQYKTGKEFV